MPSTTYSSTRGSPSQKSISFSKVVMSGLAHDRGLFVPDEIPKIDMTEVETWRNLSYADMSTELLSKYIGSDEIPLSDLRSIVTIALSSFRVPEVTPVVKVGGHYVLELFHGPTFAFKDVALQMLGGFFEYFLKKGMNGGRLAVLGATSGDTGSAAIAGLRGKEGVDCVILYPKGRVSEIQERQMTTIMDPNIHCVAVEGTFDDCQDIVKASFGDKEFREEVKLGAVNSINWARVLAQQTYYFWTYLRVTDDPSVPPGSLINFAVPTGNFGDILAGYYAKRMGLPVGELTVATNENDILHRFFTKGEYHRRNINKSISPSMDICVSSNFERYLYHLLEEDAGELKNLMTAFEDTGRLTITGARLKKAKQDFSSARADTEETLAVIKQYHAEHNYMLCPHSAVGVSALIQNNSVDNLSVALATAHEAKFPAAVSMAVPDLPTPPPQLAKLFSMKTRSQTCACDAKAVQDFVKMRIAERVNGGKKKDLGSKLGALAVAVGVLAVLAVVLTRKH
ncbi:hypothetical protein TrLO_g15171 [Triparma laevis f. longispina]|uniref:threonine synthase n=1 Tax=Triparma laevis f. longispina TaxID=1714387 RepID=A0A9W7FNX5_9STRA|nr:hypothetical protein TrLO_g15171 [Triparma laevis f. longispina]